MPFLKLVICVRFDANHSGRYQVISHFCFDLHFPDDCKEIQPVHPKGDQPWVFIGRTDTEAETPILWPPHVKS